MIRATVLVCCAGLEVASSWLLLLAPSLPMVPHRLGAAALHLTAGLLLLTSSGSPRSRRWLSAAAMLFVPFAGLGVAVAIFFTKGCGSARAETFRRQAWQGLPIPYGAVPQTAIPLSPCDALGTRDPEKRRVALLSLARRSDPEAVALLRWAASGRDPELAVSASLALDEIAERVERSLVGPSIALKDRRAAV